MSVELAETTPTNEQDQGENQKGGDGERTRGQKGESGLSAHLEALREEEVVEEVHEGGIAAAEERGH